MSRTPRAPGRRRRRTDKPPGTSFLVVYGALVLLLLVAVVNANAAGPPHVDRQPLGPRTGEAMTMHADVVYGQPLRSST